MCARQRTRGGENGGEREVDGEAKLEQEQIRWMERKKRGRKTRK